MGVPVANIAFSITKPNKMQKLPNYSLLAYSCFKNLYANKVMSTVQREYSCQVARNLRKHLYHVHMYSGAGLQIFGKYYKIFTCNLISNSLQCLQSYYHYVQ